MTLAFPARFGASGRDAYAENLRDHLLLELQALLSDDEAPYAGPLEELRRALVAMLAGSSLHPLDPHNAVLRLERAYADGVAELEQAGHRTEGLSLYAYLHKLEYLGRKQAAETAPG